MTTMVKTKKPVKKPAAKVVSKAPAKATPAKHTEKMAGKVAGKPHKATGKDAAKDAPKDIKLNKKAIDTKVKVDGKKSVEKTPEPKAAAKKQSGKIDKAASKKKPRRDEEEFLPEPEESGGEDLPDLEEFDEESEEVEGSEEVEEEIIIIEESEEVIEEASQPTGDDEVILTDAEGRRYCKVKDCDQVATVDGYCRFHYLLLWKKIQVRRKILIDGKLERYVEELTARYPDKFLEMIRRDLKTEKDFQTAIAELEIDESGIDNEFEDETQNYIDEVRGVTEGGSMGEEEEF